MTMCAFPCAIQSALTMLASLCSISFQLRRQRVGAETKLEESQPNYFVRPPTRAMKSPLIATLLAKKKLPASIETILNQSQIKAGLSRN